MRIVTLPGVFRPISDTWLLVRALLHERLDEDTTVLDVCTGSGAVAVAAARAGAGAVTAVDVSRRAVLSVRCNARLNGVRIDARRSDLFGALGPERFDVITSNPPYVPDPRGDALPRHGARRAWDAGSNGRALLDRVIAEAPAHLRAGGRLLVVHSDICGTAASLEGMRAAGLAPELVAAQRGPLGPLMRARREHLVARGSLAAGAATEQVVVIAARAA